MRYFAVVATTAVGLLCGSAAWAANFNDETRCSVLTRSLDAENEMDVSRSAKYLADTFKDLDRTRAAKGAPALFDPISDAGLRMMARMGRDAASLCAFSPEYSVLRAATVVYTVTVSR